MQSWIDMPKRVLTAAGIDGIADTDSVFETDLTLTLSEDAKLRFGGFPAGTHKVANAYAGARRLVASMYYAITPDAVTIRDILRPYHKIRQNRAAYHVGAQFLTGRPRAEAEESVAETMLGRIGTFLRIVMPRSTLTASPHFEASRVQSYSDYDGDYESRLTALRSRQATMSSKSMDRILAGFSLMSTRIAQEVADAFGVSVAFELQDEPTPEPEPDFATAEYSEMGEEAEMEEEVASTSRPKRKATFQDTLPRRSRRK